MTQKTRVIRGGTFDPVGCENNFKAIFGPAGPTRL
jgi:hypothetical protein